METTSNTNTIVNNGNKESFMKALVSFIIFVLFVLYLIPTGVRADVYQSFDINQNNRINQNSHITWKNTKKAMLKAHKALVKVVLGFYADPVLRKEAFEMVVAGEQKIILDHAERYMLLVQKEQSSTTALHRLYGAVLDDLKDSDSVVMKVTYLLYFAVTNRKVSDADATKSFCKQFWEDSSRCYNLAIDAIKGRKSTRAEVFYSMLLSKLQRLQ